MQELGGGCKECQRCGNKCSLQETCWADWDIDGLLIESEDSQRGWEQLDKSGLVFGVR